MIQARVSMDAWNSNKTTGEIEAWLNQTVGQRAQESDGVDESRPWGARYQLKEGNMMYYFARESDATMFKLRWA